MPDAIGLDYTAAIHQRAGIGRYVRELTGALARLRPDADLRLFAAGAGGRDLPPIPHPATLHPSRLSERTHNRLWHRLRLPLPVELWTGRLGLFHAADFALPPTLPHTRTVLTVFDLSYESYPDEAMPGMARYLAAVVPRSARRADQVMTISEASRADLIRRYGIPADKVSIAYPGVEGRFHPQPDPERQAALRAQLGLPHAPLVLTVGTLQPRKNHVVLVDAFARLAATTDAVLIIAGGEGWAYGEVRRRVAKLQLSERVKFAGFVPDGDLPTLYRLADVFVYPSLYEGFGLPVLEAMACGVPVVTSDRSSMPEITGPDAGLLADPTSAEDTAAAIATLLADSRLAASLRERGLARAKGFTWERTAKAVWEVYDRLLG
jgi:glycosyltransferase involved in cell wall biosynthesis